jgi:phospholipase C
MKSFDLGRFALSISAAVAFLAACGGSQPPIGAPGAMPQSRASATQADRGGSWMAPVNVAGPHGKIRHIVVLMQEGRTLNNLFTGWPNAFAPRTAFALNIGLVFLKSITYSEDRSMCELSPYMNIAYWHGTMEGFDINRFCKLGCSHCPKGDKPDTGLLPYSYMDHTQIAPYREIARQYVLADNMYATEFGADFTAHQDLIAGSTFVTPNRALQDVPSAQPWGCDAPKGTRIALWGYPYETASPCITQYPTMAELLDQAKLSWKYYVAPLSGSDPSGRLWNAFDAIKKIRYGSDWTKNIVSPPSQVLTDAKKGTLPTVAWVIPELAWSDHPSQTDDKGPSWVATVVNAIGTGPEWDSTAIIIVWSEWGGWFDARPPYFPKRLKGTGLGFRVPLLIISPYTKENVVIHTDYQYGSILRFIEQAFDLPSLSTLGYGYVFTDATSNSLSDSFDFLKGPRAFQPIKAKYPSSIFQR